MLYLLEFSKPQGSRRHYASHYLGTCEDGRLEERLAEHRAGHGARITAAAVAIGAELRVVWTGEGGRNEERLLKRQHNHKRLTKSN